MRYLLALAATLMTMTMVAACNRDGASSANQPTERSNNLAATQQADQPAGDLGKPAEAVPTNVPSASASADSDATLGSTLPQSTTASNSLSTAQANSQSAGHSSAQPTSTHDTSVNGANGAAGSATHARRVVKHPARHHTHSIARNHRHHGHRHSVAQARKQNRNQVRNQARIEATGTGVVDLPQADQQSEREQFKREMQARVTEIGNGVSRYHNSASITDSLTPYAQNIEDVKVADILARRQLRTIDTVSNDKWPSFKSNFQNQVSQLEQDYHNLQQARR